VVERRGPGTPPTRGATPPAIDSLRRVKSPGWTRPLDPDWRTFATCIIQSTCRVYIQCGYVCYASTVTSHACRVPLYAASPDCHSLSGVPSLRRCTPTLLCPVPPPKSHCALLTISAVTPPSHTGCFYKLPQWRQRMVGPPALPARTPCLLVPLSACCPSALRRTLSPALPAPAVPSGGRGWQEVDVYSRAALVLKKKKAQALMQHCFWCNEAPGHHLLLLMACARVHSADFCPYGSCCSWLVPGCTVQTSVHMAAVAHGLCQGAQCRLLSI